MKLNRKVLFASISGGVLEIYDFIVYGLLASTLAPLLFNAEDPFSSLIQSYIAFCVGFFARPIGALIFGHLGDVYGRKRALIFSSLLMALSTLALGLIPTYEQIGVWASISVFIIRILQGISVGGEYTGGIIMSVEHTSKERRGAVGAYVVAGYLGGIFLGTLTSFLFTLPIMPSWGWRLPFLFGCLIVGVGYYIRNKVDESPEFVKAQETKPESFFQDFLKVPHLFLACMGMAGFGGVFLYTITVHIPTYLKSAFNISNSTMMFIPILPTFCMMIGVITFGTLSDRVGRIPLMKVGAIIFAIVVVPLVYLIKGLSLEVGILALMAIGFISTIYNGPMNTLVVEVFAPLHRYKSAAISYSLGMSLFGGTAPLVAAWITKESDGPFLLSCYFLLVGLMGLGAIKIVEMHFKAGEKGRREFTPSFMTS
jgi:MHS family proline/betaine transporter-like MFS transporter